MDEAKKAAKKLKSEDDIKDKSKKIKKKSKKDKKKKVDPEKSLRGGAT